MDVFPASILCPQCGYSPEYNGKLAENNSNITENFKIKLLKKTFLTKKVGGWIMVLYKCSSD
jgi:hypothetical protein